MENKLYKIYFISSNKDKYFEIKSIFEGSDIEILNKDLNIEEIQTNDINEISKHKALRAYEIMKKPVLVDDTGFIINDLNEFPGALAKYFINGLGLYYFNEFIKLLKNKEAKFKTVLTLYDGKNLLQFEDSLEGQLRPLGAIKDEYFKNKLPYNIFFYPKGFNKSVYELKKEGYKINQRVKAARKLKDYLVNYYNNNEK